VRTTQRAHIEGLVARIQDEDTLHRGRSVAAVSAHSSATGVTRLRITSDIYA
jgi:hypothetical protein